VQRNPVNCALLDQAARLDVPDWWLTAGALFQTVWNVIDGRDPTAGIGDYDLFYFDDTDLSWDAEDAVIRRAAKLFADIQPVVEVRNEARVHLWYEQRFGVPAEPFTSTTDAVDHFASTTCCYAVTRDSHGRLQVYAPHGYDDLFCAASASESSAGPTRDLRTQSCTLVQPVARSDRRPMAGEPTRVPSPVTDSELDRS